MFTLKRSENLTTETTDNSAKQPYIIRVLHYIITVAFPAFMFASTVVVFAFLSRQCDPDNIWHYKVGEQIVQSGKITFENTFTWLEGTQWNQHEWLWDVILYSVTHYFGMYGYFIMGMCLSFLPLFYFAVVKKPKYLFVSFVCYLFSIITFGNFLINRPLLASMYILFFIVYWHYALTDKENTDDKKKYTKLFIINTATYFVLGILMANLHGAMVLIALGFIAILITIDAFMSFRFKAYNLRHYVIRVTGLAVFALGSLVNPNGIKLYTEVPKTFGMDSSTHISEWKPLTVSTIPSAIFLVIVILAIGYGIRKALKNQDIKELSKLIFISGLIAFEFYTIKMGCVIEILLLYIVYGYVAEMIDEFLPILSITINEKEFKDRTRISAILGIVGVALIIYYSGAEAGTFMDYAYSDENVLSEYIDEDILDYLQTASAEDEDFTVLNGYAIGNFLLGKDIPVFVDSRQQPYAKENGYATSCDEVMHIYNMSYAEFDEFLEKYEFEYVWTAAFPDYDEALDANPNYELVMRSANYDEKPSYDDCNAEDTTSSLYKRVTN